MVKCRICGKKLPKNEAYALDKINKKGKKYATWYYHYSCYQNTEKERNARYELICAIKDIFNISYPTGYMLKQIKEFREKRGYSYKNMTLALKYFFLIKGNKPTVQSLGIIPYIHEEAKRFWLNVEQKKKQLEQQKRNSPSLNVIKYKINNSDDNPVKNKLVKSYDMENL